MLFNQPVSGGSTVRIISQGITFVNNLENDGSVTVSSITTTSQVSTTVSGGQLHMSCPPVWTGLHVQVRTDTLAKRLDANWFAIPKTDLNNSYSATLGKQTNNSVLHRLAP
jgi:hypothetical protein